MEILHFFLRIICIRKKQPTPEPFDGRDPLVKLEVSTNGRLDGPSQYSQPVSFSALSPKSPEDDEFYDDQKTETLDRRYSTCLPF